MPLRPQLLAELQAAIGNAMMPNLTVTSAGYDLFEAYVFGLVLQAARSEGATVTFLDVHGNVPTIFTLRTSPGHIWSTANDYCHAVIDFPNCPLLESHVGVYVSGKSKVMHEIDVLVLYQQEAEACRQNGVMPRNSEVVIGIECKFYSAANLNIGLGRGFLGLCRDQQGSNYCFATNTTSSSLSKLLSYHKMKWRDRVTPNSSNDVTVFKSSLQTMFRNYRAKYE